MIILGVDPGLKATGYGFLKYENRQIKLLETGTINPKARDPFEQRIFTVYKNLGELIEEYKPEVLVLEKLYSHHTFVTTASIMGHVRGAICLLCAQHKIRLVEESVKRVRKMITGNGNATKLQTQRIIVHQFHLEQQKLPLDASDALALAVGFVNVQSRVQV